MRPKQLFFLLLGLVVLSIGGAGVVYYTVRNNLENDLLTITEKQAELEAIDTQVLLLKETQSKLSQLREDEISERIDELLPTSKNQTQSIQQLFTIFNDQGIPIESLQFAATEEKPEFTSQSEASPVPGVWSIPITVNFTDPMSYNQLKRLIATIESSSRHLSLHDLQVVPVADDPTLGIINTGNVDVTMVLYVHYLSNEQAGSSNPAKSKEEILKQIEASTKGDSN